MADFSNIENQIDNAITTNGVGAITGAILNAILKGMLSAVDAAKEDTLTFDITPTEDSTHPVTSGGVYDALAAAAQDVATTLANYYTKTQADTLLSAKADDSAVVHNTGDENIYGVKSFQKNVMMYGSGNYANKVMVTKLTMASNGEGIDANGKPVTDLPTPSADTDAATKKYVDDGLAAKQDTLTIDATPTDGSDNPVASNGVYDALAAKQDAISDLDTIRSGAAAGATAVQPATMQTEIGNVAFQTGEKVNATKLINDLTTGGATDVLSAEQGKELNELQMMQVTAEIVDGAYIATNDSSLPANRATGASISSSYIPVQEGDIVVIRAGASSSSFYLPWATVDANGNYITKATLNVNYRTTPQTIVVDNTIKAIVVNFKGYDALQDGITHYTYFKDEMSADIAALKNETTTNYDDSVLTTGYYYDSGNDIIISSSSTMRKCILPIKAGDKVTIRSKTSSSSLYIITDKAGNVLTTKSATNATIVEEKTTATKDGFVLVNCVAGSADVFNVAITRKAQETKTPPSLFQNNPFPVGNSTLKVLAIGNSYTSNCTEYLSELVAAAGLDTTKFCVYILVSSSATLQYWSELQESTTAIRRAGDITMTSSGTLDEILAQDWDVVILQQESNAATDQSTYYPYLKDLVNRVKNGCPNTKLCIGFNLVWSHYNSVTDFIASAYESITDAVKAKVYDYGIDFILPAGTAIQNARNTALNSAHYLTNDGTHLAYGVARYIVACVWYQMILARVFGVSLVGNTAIHTVTATEIADAQYEYADVTASNREMCQNMALYATIDSFNVWNTLIQ